MYWRIFFVLLASFQIISCTSVKWTDRHPAFPESSALGEIAMPELGDRWILVRGTWFAEQLALPPSQVYDTVGALIQQSFTDAAIQIFPTLRTISSKVMDSLPPPESQMLDEQIYLKARLPAQGQIVTEDGFAPPQLLLVHEVTIGPDVSRETLYDYQKANLDTEGRKRKVRNIKAIATWTLWDNYRQRFLVSGISEVLVPWEEQKGNDLRVVTASLVEKLVGQMKADLGSAQ